jgi:glycine hydroxymethyltransferase
MNDPLPHYIVTTTTHKTLRGPRGGLILMGKDFENPFGLTTPKGIRMMSSLLDLAVFQGIKVVHYMCTQSSCFWRSIER